MPSQPTYVLQIQSQYGGGDEHPVLKAELTLGRRPKNDIVLEDPKVSSRHARITFASGGPQTQPLVVDLGSSNGTLLNGQPLRPHSPAPMRPGDVVTIGPFSLSVRLATAQAPAPAPVAERVKINARPTPGVAVYINNKLTKYELDKPIMTLGRASDNTLHIQHPQVSGHHARLQQTPQGYIITDLNSANGIVYNGQRVPRHTFSDGDVVYLSKEVLVQFRAHVGLVPATAKKKSAPPQPRTQLIQLEAQETYSIGRVSGNDMVLDHPQVSRHHALMERLGGRYRIKDLKSSNGVYVNGKRIDKEAWLKEGDKIRIGPHNIVFAEDGIQQVSDEGLRLDVFKLRKQVNKSLNLLQEISLSIHPQEFVALVGLSGAGKSTLMDAINGFRPATDGTVLINGDNLYQNFDLYRNDMGYVPQQDIVHKELTVYSALDYAAKLRMPADTTAKERHQRVMEVMRELDIIERRDVPIKKLSGGQLKRVSIGVELITKPRLFFLDEPTSGLDPGTEYKMMRLLRHLADQGRTVMLITHATKNVMMCDKVIILVRGGHLAYYGPPEEALTYFNQFRTEEERRTKDMEFDDIYMLLEDDKRGSSEKWAERYKRSKQYRENVVERLQETRAPSKTPVSRPKARKSPGSRRISGLRQFFILSARNLKIMAQDKAGLGLLLALAPILSVMEFSSLDFDAETGDAGEIIMVMFMNALISFLVGALTSVREIVKETDIYKREHATTLKIVPYVMSKVWVGFVLALYTAFMFLVVRQGMMTKLWPGTAIIGPETLGWVRWGALFFTFFLNSLTGYLMGLLISAAAPNQNVAILLVIVALVPQFLFAGGMMPLDLLGDGGKIVSQGVSTRWAFESALNILDIGEPIAEDPCWDDQPVKMLNLTDEEKQAKGCICMGTRIFSGPCQYFPGIKSAEYYTDAAQRYLNQPEPEEPKKPGEIDTESPDPPDSCQTGNTLTCQEFYAYLDELQKDMKDYADELSNWKRAREKAISSAEGLLRGIYENQGAAFQDTYTERWVTMGIIIVVLLGLIVTAQKVKDVL